MILTNTTNPTSLAFLVLLIRAAGSWAGSLIGIKHKVSTAPHCVVPLTCTQSALASTRPFASTNYQSTELFKCMCAAISISVANCNDSYFFCKSQQFTFPIANHNNF